MKKFKKFFLCIGLALIMVITPAMLMACGKKEEKGILNIELKGDYTGEYFVGDKFNFEDLQFLITYVDDSTKLIDLKSSMLSKFDTSTPGKDKTLFIYYKDKAIYKKYYKCFKSEKKCNKIVKSPLTRKVKSHIISNNVEISRETDFLQLFVDGSVIEYPNEESETEPYHYNWVYEDKLLKFTNAGEEMEPYTLVNAGKFVGEPYGEGNYDALVWSHF